MLTRLGFDSIILNKWKKASGLALQVASGQAAETILPAALV